MNPIITYIALHELNNSLREINSNELSKQLSYSHSDNSDYLLQIQDSAISHLEDNNPERDISSCLIIIKQNIRSLR